MTKRVQCGEGKHCHKCLLGAELLKLGLCPSFPLKEGEERCEWYDEEENDC